MLGGQALASVTSQSVNQLINCAYSNPELQKMLNVRSSDDLSALMEILQPTGDVVVPLPLPIPPCDTPCHDYITILA